MRNSFRDRDHSILTFLHKLSSTKTILSSSSLCVRFLENPRRLSEADVASIFHRLLEEGTKGEERTDPGASGLGSSQDGGSGAAASVSGAPGKKEGREGSEGEEEEENGEDRHGEAQLQWYVLHFDDLLLASLQGSFSLVVHSVVLYLLFYIHQRISCYISYSKIFPRPTLRLSIVNF